MRLPGFDLDATSVSQSLLLRLKLLGLIALMSLAIPSRVLAQEERPALIPIASTGGPSSASITATSNGGISDGPIVAGDVVHVNVFNAPDLSTITRVSMNGDIAFPLLGAFHIAGLNSLDAGQKLADQLKAKNFVLDPSVAVTVDSTATGITVLGEVHSPGIFPPNGKKLLSDLLAQAGGVTANTGRVIEISNNSDPGNKSYVPWDPTMHNTSSYDHPVRPGDRIIVRACGIAYVGGNVSKPGAYSLCGSPQMTLSELVALAGGVVPSTSTDRTTIVRTHPDGTKTAIQVDLKKILLSKSADVIVQEDDVIYVPPSALKNVAKAALAFSMTLTTTLLYVYRP